MKRGNPRNSGPECGQITLNQAELPKPSEKAVKRLFSRSIKNETSWRSFKKGKLSVVNLPF
jgi:hypothetical protein